MPSAKVGSHTGRAEQRGLGNLPDTWWVSNRRGGPCLSRCPHPRPRPPRLWSHAAPRCLAPGQQLCHCYPWQTQVYCYPRPRVRPREKTLGMRARSSTQSRWNLERVQLLITVRQTFILVCLYFTAPNCLPAHVCRLARYELWSRSKPNSTVHPRRGAKEAWRAKQVGSEAPFVPRGPRASSPCTWAPGVCVSLGPCGLVWFLSLCVGPAS